MSAKLHVSIGVLLAVLPFVPALAWADTARVDLAALWVQGEDRAADQDTAKAAASKAEASTAEAGADRDLRIQVWHDKGEDEVYQRGEAIGFHFRTNADAYVVVYRIDADGVAEVLWPATRYNDGFVYGGHAYTLPPAGATHRLHASLSKGVEYVEALASRYPFDLRNLAIDFAFDPDEQEHYRHKVAGDPFLAVNDVNYAITGLEQDVDYIVTDWSHVYVDSRVDYPRYACSQCHGDDGRTVHPYVDTCTQVSVHYDWGWYSGWWGRYGYYPLFYDPPFYYWDLVGCRPYYFWYYPVCYRWPGSGVYVRSYPLWSWNDSPYYRGDYLVRYRHGAAVTAPLYAVDGPASERRFGRQAIRGGEPPSIARARVASAGGGGRMTAPADRGLGRLPDRERTAPLPAPHRSTALVPRETGGGVRTDAVVRRERSVRSLPSPAHGDDGTDRSGGETRVAPQPRSGESRDTGARRWTRPVIRNSERGPDRGGPPRKVVSPPRDGTAPGARSRGDQDDSGRGASTEPGPPAPRPSRSEQVAPPPRQAPPPEVAPPPRSSAPAPQAPPPRSAPAPRQAPSPRGGGDSRHGAADRGGRDGGAGRSSAERGAPRGGRS
jgi:hypothetical protein